MEAYPVDDYGESSDWVCIKDRGGLNHLSYGMYMLMCSLEIEVKHHIKTNVKPDKFNTKDVFRKLMTNEDVEHYWDTLSINWSEEDRVLLLSMIIDHWITVRGFAYTSAWMEKYKNTEHKKVQRSKGIRKTVMGSTSSNSDDNTLTFTPTLYILIL